MRTQAELVIIGAGIVGCSAAYHLSQMGWKDIVVIDKGPLFETGGSTSHAPGLVFQTNGSKTMTEFAMTTTTLLGELGNYDDGDPVWYPVGGIEVAYTDARWQELKRKHGLATSYGLEGHLITPAEVKQRIPLVNHSVIKGGFYVPSDGDARAWRAADLMSRKAREAGVEFYGNVTVTNLTTSKGAINTVETDQGTITCEKVLLCTNIWSPIQGDHLNITLPLMAVEHQYLISEPLAELAGETRFIAHPILRHQDFSMYFRQHGDAYGIGSYKHDPLLVSPYDVGRNAMRPFTEADFGTAQAAADELLPALKGKRYPTTFNGMFAFTPDGMPIMGETPQVSNFWLALGVWVTHSGGVGKAIAEWMTQGYPETDVREANVSRFHAHVSNRSYFHARCAQQYREVYDIIHPRQQMAYPRPLRLAPFHARMEALQGVFFESQGWEVAQWYEANAPLLDDYGDRVPARDDWASRYWSRIEGAEALATRERAGLFNVGAFVKIEVSGPGAAGYLERLAANKVARNVGKVVYTALLNEVGGIQADLTITRLAEDRFWVLTGAGVGMNDLHWVRHHAPTDGSVHVQDITSAYTALGLWGPRARDILAAVAEEDLSNAAFPYFSAKPLRIGNVPAYALRVSYVGELGWEIYAPTEYGLALWDTLWQAGQPHGLVAVGGGAFDALRLEKGYRLWGADIYTEHNPYEAGLDWAVRLSKPDFIGRDALLKIQDAGVGRKLCAMTFDAPDAMALGKEPIMVNGEKVGYVTSANTGYCIGKHIAYGYLPLACSAPGTRVEIVYFDQPQIATVAAEPLYDPEMAKLRT